MPAVMAKWQFYVDWYAGFAWLVFVFRPSDTNLGPTYKTFSDNWLLSWIFFKIFIFFSPGVAGAQQHQSVQGNAALPGASAIPGPTAVIGATPTNNQHQGTPTSSVPAYPQSATLAPNPRLPIPGQRPTSSSSDILRQVSIHPNRMQLLSSFCCRIAMLRLNHI